MDDKWILKTSLHTNRYGKKKYPHKATIINMIFEWDNLPQEVISNDNKYF